MSIPVVGGMPGIRSLRTATPRHVFKGGWDAAFVPGGKVINGSLSRDSGNTGDLDVLRAGLLMGIITASGKYAPSILGLTDAAYTSGTSLTLTAAAAVELARRVGTSGTFKLTGPPASAGVVVTETITFSAVNTSTGEVTITAAANNFISGSFVQPTDGSEDPVAPIPDQEQYGIKVTDQDGTSQDTPFPSIPVSGMIESAQIIFWPSDTSLRAWIVSNLNNNGGQFVFDHLY